MTVGSLLVGLIPVVGSRDGRPGRLCRVLRRVHVLSPTQPGSPDEDIDCGRLVVPENRRGPGPGTLELAVAILRATDTPVAADRACPSTAAPASVVSTRSSSSCALR